MTYRCTCIFRVQKKNSIHCSQHSCLLQRHNVSHFLTQNLKFWNCTCCSTYITKSYYFSMQEFDCQCVLFFCIFSLAPFSCLQKVIKMLSFISERQNWNLSLLPLTKIFFFNFKNLYVLITLLGIQVQYIKGAHFLNSH